MLRKPTRGILRQHKCRQHGGATVKSTADRVPSNARAERAASGERGRAVRSASPERLRHGEGVEGRVVTLLCK